MIFTMLQIISGSISPLPHIFDHMRNTLDDFLICYMMIATTSYIIFTVWWENEHISSFGVQTWRFTVFALLCFSFVVCPCVVCITSNSLLHQRVKEERWSLVIIHLLLQKCTDFAWNFSFIIVPLSSFESFWVSHTKSVLIWQICVIMQYNFSEKFLVSRYERTL